MTDTPTLGTTTAGAPMPLDAEALAKALTPAQRHVVLRCSEAQEWGGVGYGFTRKWPDLVYGRDRLSCRTIYALIRLGVMRNDDRDHGLYGLTELGLSVQFHLRQMIRRGE